MPTDRSPVSDKVEVVCGVFEDALFKITKYPTSKDLQDPELCPIFHTRVQNDKGMEPDEWVILVAPGKPDLFFKADPRKNDMQRDWPQGKQFPTFFPVYQIKRIGRWNRFAKIAKRRVEAWIKKEFTFLQTSDEKTTSAG